MKSVVILVIIAVAVQAYPKGNSSPGGSRPSGGGYFPAGYPRQGPGSDEKKADGRKSCMKACVGPTKCKSPEQMKTEILELRKLCHSCVNASCGSLPALDRRAVDKCVRKAFQSCTSCPPEPIVDRVRVINCTSCLMQCHKPGPRQNNGPRRPYGGMGGEGRGNQNMGGLQAIMGMITNMMNGQGRGPPQGNSMMGGNSRGPGSNMGPGGMGNIMGMLSGVMNQNGEEGPGGMMTLRDIMMGGDDSEDESETGGMGNAMGMLTGMMNGGNDGLLGSLLGLGGNMDGEDSDPGENMGGTPNIMSIVTNMMGGEGGGPGGQNMGGLQGMLSMVTNMMGSQSGESGGMRGFMGTNYANNAEDGDDEEEYEDIKKMKHSKICYKSCNLLKYCPSIGDMKSKMQNEKQACKDCVVGECGETTANSTSADASCIANARQECVDCPPIGNDEQMSKKKCLSCLKKCVLKDKDDEEDEDEEDTPSRGMHGRSGRWGPRMGGGGPLPQGILSLLMSAGTNGGMGPSRGREQMGPRSGGMGPFSGGMGPFSGGMGPYSGGRGPYSGGMGPFSGGMGPFSGGIGPFSGGMGPFSGGMGPYSGGRGPNSGGMGPFSGGMGPFSGGMGPYSGGRGPNSGGIGPFSGGMGPFSGGMGPYSGGRGPNSGGMGPFSGGMGPFSGGMGPFSGGRGPHSGGKGPYSKRKGPKRGGGPMKMLGALLEVISCARKEENCGSCPTPMEAMKKIYNSTVGCMKCVKDECGDMRNSSGKAECVRMARIDCLQCPPLDDHEQMEAKKCRKCLMGCAPRGPRREKSGPQGGMFGGFEMMGGGYGDEMMGGGYGDEMMGGGYGDEMMGGGYGDEMMGGGYGDGLLGMLGS